MEGIPSYRRIYSALKQDIRDGVYVAGDLIPTEPELEKKYGVSRTTVRKAIELLASEGYVRAKQGKGTEVLDASTTQKLNYITSFTETLTEKGYNVTTRGMCIDKVVAPNYVAEALELNPNEMVYRVQRIQCIDGQPIGILVNYLKEKVVPDLEKYSGTFISLYRFLEKQYNIILESAVERITATAADFTESQILQVNIGTPLLYSKRVTYSRSTPIEYAQIKLIADKYEYCIYMQGRL